MLIDIPTPLMFIVFIALLLDAGIGLYIKFQLMTKKKKLFICDQEGDNCEEI